MNNLSYNIRFFLIFTFIFFLSQNTQATNSFQYKESPFKLFQNMEEGIWKTETFVQDQQKFHVAAVKGEQQNTLFILSLPVNECRTEALTTSVFYPANNHNNKLKFKAGAYMMVFRQYYSSPTFVYKEKKQTFIQIDFDNKKLDVNSLLNSLQKGALLAIIWQDSNLKPIPVEFALNNSYDTIQELYNNCMNDTYEQKRKKNE